MYGVTRTKEVCVALLQNVRINKGWHKKHALFLKLVMVNTSEAKCILKSLPIESDAFGKCLCNKARYCEMSGT